MNRFFDHKSSISVLIYHCVHHVALLQIACFVELHNYKYILVIISVTCEPLTQVLPGPQLIFPSKTWFFGIYLNFQWQKPLQNQYLPHSESKSYQINCIESSHQDLSNNTKGTFQFLWNFQLRFNLIFSEEIILYSRTFAPQV